MKQPFDLYRDLTRCRLVTLVLAIVCSAAPVAPAQRPGVQSSAMQGGSVPPSFAQGQYPQGQISPGGEAAYAPNGYSQGATGGRAAAAPDAYVASAAGTPAGDGGRAGGMIPAAESGESGGSAEGENSEGGEAEEPGASSSIVGRLRNGGPLMIPLAICSLIVMALAVERLVALRRGRIIPRPFVRRFTECVQDGQLSYDEALEICDEFQCPVAEVFHATVKRWGRPTVEVEQAVMDAGERVADGLRRYLRVFQAVSNVAPLLGLLGTVLGMIQAFETLGSSASASPPDLLAAGISQALITTAAGLSVAIPAYLAYIYFSARADRYLVEIDALCQQVVDAISAEGLQGGTAAGRAAGKRAKKAA